MFPRSGILTGVTKVPLLIPWPKYDRFQCMKDLKEPTNVPTICGSISLQKRCWSNGQSCWGRNQKRETCQLWSESLKTDDTIKWSKEMNSCSWCWLCRIDWFENFKTHTLNNQEKHHSKSMDIWNQKICHRENWETQANTSCQGLHSNEASRFFLSISTYNTSWVS